MPEADRREHENLCTNEREKRFFFHSHIPQSQMNERAIQKTSGKFSLER